MENRLSKNKISFIRSLENKKQRTESDCFLAEGPKIVGDLLSSFHCRLLVCEERWMQENKNTFEADEVCCVDAGELHRASLMKTPQEVLAVFEQRKETADTSLPERELCLALDNVQNPGNMGTIVRIADWFGIEHIFCSPDSADIYNPKTIQATMGALAHVHLHYLSLEDFIRQQKEDVAVYGTLLNGENMYQSHLQSNGIIVMGNEGRGICPEIESLITHKLWIPNFPQGRTTTDSLNVAIATSVVCAEFRRQTFYSTHRKV
jgi:TrmH family RNA methyltransferase